MPPLLTVAGEVTRLSYDVYCPAPGGTESGAPCDAAGTAYVRAGDTGAFQPLTLSRDPTAAEGRYGARVPSALAEAPAGFSYYAVVRNRATGATLTVPAGGASAPQRSLPLRAPVEVDLGAHLFGHGRAPDERVFTAAWGDGPTEAGLEGGPETQAIGPSAFDVDGRGSVTVLDQVHRRVLRVEPGTHAATATPLGVNGTLADLAVDRDGTLWVLETAGPGGPLLRAFDSHEGEARGAVPLAERTAAQLRLGPEGPIVKQYPSEQWLPATAGARSLARRAQSTRGESAVPLEDGRRVAVLRVADEVRVALIADQDVRRAWRIRSATPLAEVQLAEPLGERLVVVVRVFTQSRDEFVALVLDRSGVASRFALDTADWAETAPLSRFRLAGGALYQLGSTPKSVRVDRFDLEVN